MGRSWTDTEVGGCRKPGTNCRGTGRGGGEEAKPVGAVQQRLDAENRCGHWQRVKPRRKGQAIDQHEKLV